jgi:Gas vesicle synthesis protein GvpO
VPTSRRDGRVDVTEAPSHERTTRDLPDEEYDEEEYEEMSPSEVVGAALSYITEFTGKDLRGVVSLEPSEHGWIVGVEVVEDRRVPSSNDVLGLYLTEIDADGYLRTYRRTKRYSRGRGDDGEVT